MRKESDFEAYLDTIKQYAAEEGYESLDETFVNHLKCRFWGQDVVIGESARVLLREMKMSDLEAFYAFEDVHKEPVLEAFIKESMEVSKKHLQAYIEHMYSLYDYGMWTVINKKSGEIIGICGLGQTAYQGAECTDLGYYICPKCRKQKYATECIEIVLDYAKNYLEFPVIYAIIKKENRISAGILRKFGFQCIEIHEKSFVFQKELAE